MESHGGFAVVAQQVKQCLKTFGRFLGAKDDLSPPFKAIRGAMPPGKPVVNIFQWNMEEQGISLQFFSNQVMQCFHGGECLIATVHQKPRIEN